MLPREVHVAIGAVAGRSSVTVTTADGGERRVEASPGGVAVDGAAPVARATFAGPVWVEARRHDGDVTVELSRERGLHVVAHLALETYVAGVVAAELSLWSARPAELEAQAIAARTFAAAELLRSGAAGRRELTDGVLDQAYRGTYSERGSSGAIEAGARLDAAIEATRGLVLLRGDRLEEARYHAACGGHTADFDEVFADEVRERGAAGPTSVRCLACETRAAAEARAGQPETGRPLGWKLEIPNETLDRLGREIGLGGPPTRIASARFARNGVGTAQRWLEIVFERSGTRVAVPFDRVRRLIGYGELKSALVTAMTPPPGAALRGEVFQIQGLGRGHGVGLCQEAARDLAGLGWTAEQILNHYYEGTRISQIPWATQ